MSQKQNYMPEMDGLRAVAVFSVLFHHFFQLNSPIGSWGVTLFFVISGYLITKTIFRLRTDSPSILAAAGSFFARRSLRLFPAYYLVVLIAIAMKQVEVQQNWPWYVFYVSNILLTIEQRWIALTPSWSLAVEEQFYLVWFFVLMMISRQKLVYVIFALSIVAPFVRYIGFDQGNIFSFYTLWAQCDALAAGAFLFVLEVGKRKMPLSGASVVFLFLINTVALAVYGGANPWVGSIGQTVTIVAAAYLVWSSRLGFGGITGRFFSHRFVVHVGKVSYGIYLYHMLTPNLASFLGRNIPGLWRLTGDGLVGFAFHCGITLAIATLSFRYFESPIRYSIDRRNTA